MDSMPHIATSYYIDTVRIDAQLRVTLLLCAATLGMGLVEALSIELSGNIQPSTQAYLSSPVDLDTLYVSK